MDIDCAVSVVISYESDMDRIVRLDTAYILLRCTRSYGPCILFPFEPTEESRTPALRISGAYTVILELLVIINDNKIFVIINSVYFADVFPVQLIFLSFLPRISRMLLLKFIKLCLIHCFYSTP